VWPDVAGPGLATTFSVALNGVHGEVVEVQATIRSGLPCTTLAGLPDVAVTEARHRCRAAVVNSGLKWPEQVLVVGLFPASLPKTGTMYDLGIALATLAAAGTLPAGDIASTVMLGELALDGRVRSLPGILPATLAAQQQGVSRVMVPEANAAEAQIVPDMEVVAVRSLRHAVAVLCGEEIPDEVETFTLLEARQAWTSLRCVDDLDLVDVLGQVEARHCVEVAAAGGHHLLLEGPPGAGKTMLAERLPGLLPDLLLEESLEVSGIHSVAGLLSRHAPLIVRPPFLDPHHTASSPAIVGGGGKVLRPGALSLAHRGVLFMDEAPEFQARILEAVRQPLESRQVTISRSERSAVFPAAFQLVLAANPCPCGYDWSTSDRCECTPAAKRRYRDRISGPVRDRIDIHRRVNPPRRQELHDDLLVAETTATVAARVREARARQAHRYRGTRWRRNAEIPGSALRSRWLVRARRVADLEDQLAQGRLSARGVDRVLRLCWTLADLAGRAEPDDRDVEMAAGMHGAEALRLDSWQRERDTRQALRPADDLDAVGRS